MSATISSTNYNGKTANVLLYHPTGTTIPYYSATTTNVGTQTIPFTYTLNILEYGTFECSFTSPSKICSASSLAGPDGDGNYYRTVKVGSQIWLSENLKTTKYNDGTNLDNTSQVDNATWANTSSDFKKYWAYVNNSSSNTSIYGLLYNQYSITETTKNLCPSGWRVPSTTDVSTLINNLGGSSVAGKHLKYPDSDFWLSGYGGTNSSGFSLLGSAWRRLAGTYADFKALLYMWVTNNQTSYVAGSGDSFTLNTNQAKVLGGTIRCIKN